MLAVARLLLPALLLLATLVLMACASDSNENAGNVQIVKQGDVEIALNLPDGWISETDLSEVSFVPTGMEPLFYSGDANRDGGYVVEAALYYNPAPIVPISSSNAELVEYIAIYGDGIEESESGDVQRTQTTFAGYPAEAFTISEQSERAVYAEKRMRYVAFLADRKLWSFYCVLYTKADVTQPVSICDDVIASAKSK